MISTKEKNLLAYKNYQMGEILKQLKIPSFNLDEKNLNFPTYEKIQEKYGDNYLCCYHKKPHRFSNITLTCAYSKVNHLLRELNEAKEFEEMIV